MTFTVLTCVQACNIGLPYLLSVFGHLNRTGHLVNFLPFFTRETSFVKPVCFLAHKAPSEKGFTHLLE